MIKVSHAKWTSVSLVITKNIINKVSSQGQFRGIDPRCLHENRKIINELRVDVLSN